MTTLEKRNIVGVQGHRIDFVHSAVKSRTTSRVFRLVPSQGPHQKSPYGQMKEAARLAEEMNRAAGFLDPNDPNRPYAGGIFVAKGELYYDQYGNPVVHGQEIAHNKGDF